jgi:putative hemolysin
VSARNLVVQLLGLGILLLLSAFFSGSETAFFSLNSLEKDQLRRRTSGRRGRFIHVLFSQPDEVLVTVLTGNMFVNIFASAIAEALGAELFTQSAELVSIAVMTLLLLVVGEMTPKNLAIRHSLRFSQFAASPLAFIHNALKPVSVPMGRLRHVVLSRVSRSGGRSQEDQAAAVLSAIRMGYQSKTIDQSELRLLERFFRFRQKTAAEVMIPRVDVRPLDASTAVTEYLESLRGANTADSGLIPVYKQDVDHISGYVRRVDLIRFRFAPEARRLSEIAQPIHAVPASKDLRELMEEMSELGTEMCVVVDEYGGTEGIVSFPGLVDYLFEDFRPEHERAIEPVAGARFRIAGTADIGDVEAALGVEIGGSSRTIAGVVLEELGEFPKPGAEATIAGHVFRVEAIQDRRIVWLEARRDVP